MTEISCPISIASQNCPDQPALITDEKEWTYFELENIVQMVCSSLKNEEVHSLSRIAFLSKPSIFTIGCLFALLRLGATACPLNFRLPSQALKDTVEHLQAKWIDPERLRLFSFYSSSQLFLEKTATLLSTSGSLGSPKTVALSLANYYYSALGTNETIHLESSDRWLLSLPLFHVSGLAILFRCFLAKATVVVSSLALTEALQKYQITHLSLVSTQLYRLLKTATSLPFVKKIFLGGGPIPDHLFHQAKQKGYPVATTYALTEMCSQVCLSDTLDFPTVLPYRELKVLDEEILVRGKTLFQGYWKSPEQLAPPLDQEGWFATGDLAEYNEHYHLQLRGRKDLLFISGGENIYPEEIEQTILKMDSLLDVVVVPVDDVEFGARPAAFVSAERSFSPEEIKEFLKDHLPSYKIPIHFFPFPEESGFKRNRFALKIAAAQLIKNQFTY
jgi:O-succinylbenzoic acid--CoA ligase